MDMQLRCHAHFIVSLIQLSDPKKLVYGLKSLIWFIWGITFSVRSILESRTLSLSWQASRYWNKWRATASQVHLCLMCVLFDCSCACARTANISNLAQNVTVNNKRCTYQSSYVPSGAGPRGKNPYCVLIDRNNVYSATRGQTKMNAWTRGRGGREKQWETRRKITDNNNNNRKREIVGESEQGANKESSRGKTSMRGSYF